MNDCLCQQKGLKPCTTQHGCAGFFVSGNACEVCGDCGGTANYTDVARCQPRPPAHRVVQRAPAYCSQRAERYAQIDQLAQACSRMRVPAQKTQCESVITKTRAKLDLLFAQCSQSARDRRSASGPASGTPSGSNGGHASQSGAASFHPVDVTPPVCNGQVCPGGATNVNFGPPSPPPPTNPPGVPKSYKGFVFNPTLVSSPTGPSQPSQTSSNLCTPAPPNAVSLTQTSHGTVLGFSSGIFRVDNRMPYSAIRIHVGYQSQFGVDPWVRIPLISKDMGEGFFVAAGSWAMVRALLPNRTGGLVYQACLVSGKNDHCICPAASASSPRQPAANGAGHRPPHAVQRLAPASATIHVVSATYGSNCGAPQNNDQSNLAAACDGQTTCSYVVNNRNGDPAPHCAKDYRASYQCAGGLKTVYHGKTVNEGYAIRLSCSG
jgi:hypothetical protein